MRIIKSNQQIILVYFNTKFDSYIWQLRQSLTAKNGIDKYIDFPPINLLWAMTKEEAESMAENVDIIISDDPDLVNIDDIRVKNNKDRSSLIMYFERAEDWLNDNRINDFITYVINKIRPLLTPLFG